MRRLRVFLDANILFSVRLRDVYLGFAELEVIDVRWSSEVLDDLNRTLQARCKVSPEGARRLLDLLDTHFPLARIEWDRASASAHSLPDPDDIHVLAAAIAGECDLLITDNLADFPEDAIPTTADVTVLDASEGIQFLAGQGHHNIGPLIDSIIDRYNRPPMTRDEFIDGIREVAPIGGQALGAAIGNQDDIMAIATAIDAMTSGSPQTVVLEILEHLRDDTGLQLADYTSAQLQSQARDEGMTIEEKLQITLSEVLGEPASGWSVGSRPWPTSPLQSLVKLFRVTPEMSELITAPTEVYAYMCWLVYEDEAWKLDYIGGDDPSLTESS